ncbi:seipin-1 [Canna indica]|uniref:Seipin-1 n=1 Tax=Canna indica TaxID=4628 RepID=A0AAQ3K0Y1_9LILI|nr:seipin-1 [Canna indica]
MDGDTQHLLRLRRRAYSAATTTTNYPPSSTIGNDDHQLLALPAGWLIRLVTAQAELITTCFLSIASPFLYTYFQSQAVPARIAHSVTTLARRLALGLLGALYAVAVLLAVMFVSVLCGVGLVRLWVEEPVVLRQPLHFDYTEVHPSAAVPLRGAWYGGRAVPTGHTVIVSVALLLPESDYNCRIGIFQVHAEVSSSVGETIAASSQPCMLRFRSLPVRLMRTFFMGIPILLGISTESQEISMDILKYKETKKRSETIRMRLKPRSGTGDLPQLYEAELLMKTQLPWPKELVHSWRRTLYVWASLYVYFILLILLACCFKLRWPSSMCAGVERPSEVKKDYGEERAMSDKFSVALRKWRERSKRKRLESSSSSLSQPLLRAIHPELAEGSASSSSGGGGEASEEVIDDSGDFAASESSECFG